MNYSTNKIILLIAAAATLLLIVLSVSLNWGYQSSKINVIICTLNSRWPRSLSLASWCPRVLSHTHLSPTAPPAPPRNGMTDWSRDLCPSSTSECHWENPLKQRTTQLNTRLALFLCWLNYLQTTPILVPVGGGLFWSRLPHGVVPQRSRSAGQLNKTPWYA